MTVRRIVSILLAGIACVALASACASPNTPAFPKVVSLGKGELFPTILNSGLGVGQNRVSMSITDRDDNRVLDAFVRLRYYNLNGKSPKFRTEVSARFIPVELSYIDEQSNRTRAPSGNDGAYVSNVDFDEAGDWGVEITITRTMPRPKIGRSSNNASGTPPTMVMTTTSRTSAMVLKRALAKNGSAKK